MLSSLFLSRNEDDEESSVQLPNPSYSNYMQVTTRTPSDNIMQTCNNNVLGNFPRIGVIVPPSTPFLTTLFEAAPDQVTIEQLASSHTGYENSNRGIGCTGWIHDFAEAVELRSSNRLPTAGHEYYYPGDHVIDPHLVGSNPCHFDNFNVHSIPANVVNNLETAKQNHTIEAIYDVCPTPQHHARREPNEFGRRECSCHLRVKFRANKQCGFRKQEERHPSCKEFQQPSSMFPLRWHLFAYRLCEKASKGIVLGPTVIFAALSFIEHNEERELGSYAAPQSRAAR
ncbi:hypothetical protein BU17DRAFT_61167 [Hysterangium stoloniferum]|nr:hypothetical protein BU17DRAFT_61167 [Hysterangium stoloniferum]